MYLHSLLGPLLGSRSSLLLHATLRPETMYGQINCWLQPEFDYVAFETVHSEVFICTERAALNMVYQLFTSEFGKFETLVSVKGRDLMGHPLKAPCTSYDVIYTMPMLIIKKDKGTKYNYGCNVQFISSGSAADIPSRKKMCHCTGYNGDH